MKLGQFSCEDIEAIRGYNDELNHKVKQLETTLDETKEKLQKAEEELNRTRAKPEQIPSSDSNQMDNGNNNNNNSKYDALNEKVGTLEEQLNKMSEKLQGAEKKLNETSEKLQRSENLLKEERQNQGNGGGGDYGRGRYGQNTGGQGSWWNYINNGISFITSGFVVIQLLKFVKMMYF